MNMIEGEDRRGPFSVAPLYQDLFCIRTITAFITLNANDFCSLSEESKNDNQLDENTDCNESVVQRKLAKAKHVLNRLQSALEEAGYRVQTQRIATNPFPEWVVRNEHMNFDAVLEDTKKRMRHLDQCLQNIKIEFCSVGPAQFSSKASLEQAVEECVTIVSTSPRLSCSFPVEVNNVAQAIAAAECCLRISQLGTENKKCNDSKSDCQNSSPSSFSFCQGGLGNFRFCSASTTCKPFIPFFPIAYSSASTSEEGSSTSTISIGIGLENGALAGRLLKNCKTIRNIPSMFQTEMEKTLTPIQNICQHTIASMNSSFRDTAHVLYGGIDTSLNPSLDGSRGSVAAAIEQLDEVKHFGGCGTIAAAATITTALQSIPNVKRTGYCGLMLPVCEDHRLAELAATVKWASAADSSTRLSITQLMNVSSVCGVGVDTVPLRGDVRAEDLAMLILDVVGLATRWNKPLSCRVFPIPNITTCDQMTTFDFEHLCNTRVFDLP